MSDITIYTDGASSGNPGPGGYGVVLISGKHRKELSCGYKKTTNNRMELMAVIVGLEALKQPACNVTIYSDSKYVIDTVQKKWINNWLKNDFKGKKNKDLWLRFLEVFSKHNIVFQWVKGHSDVKENNRCDQLAVEASKQLCLKDDVGYDE